MKKTILFDDYNQKLQIGTDFVGSVTTTWGHKALRNGWKLIEIYDDIEEFNYICNGDRQE